MPKARKAQISLSDTRYYHCVSRCVRRAFLCGKDALTGQSYEHRRQWVEDRIHFLSDVFAIDICAYAVMSNHTHVVLHIFEEKAAAWSVEEVITRWHRLHKGTLLTHQYICPQQRQDMTPSSIKTVEDIVNVWRQRLTDISCFMKSLNEYIARKANQEDDCTGYFYSPPSLALTLRAMLKHVQIFSGKICGKADLNLRPCWMNLPWQPAWLMWTLTRSEPIWRQPLRILPIPVFNTG